MAGMWVEFEAGVRVLGELSLVDLGLTKKSVDPLYVPGANFAIRKTAFQACGGFHPLTACRRRCNATRVTAKSGLTLKMRARGLKALYHPGAAVRHVI